MDTETHQKVTTAHLSRLAYLYVRQSTLRRVFENSESAHRQYALRERAVAGAFVFGRTKQRLLPNGKVCSRLVPSQEWMLLRDMHPGYIAREEYRSNLQREEQCALLGAPSGAVDRRGNTALLCAAKFRYVGLTSGSYRQALLTPVLVLSGTTSKGTPPQCSRACIWAINHDSICWSRVASAQV
jgi:hypothetical protein